MTHNIFIKNLDGPSLSFQVDLKTQRVKDIIQKYGKKTGINPEQLRFVYAGKPLVENQTMLLHELNINNNSTIYAVGRLRGGKLVKIVVSTVQNKEFTIQIDDDKTGYQLKEQVYKNLCKSLEVATMALRYAGVEIENNKKLSYYKIVEEKGVRKIFQEKQSLGKIAGIILAYESDLYGIDQQTVRMPCGHVIGRDGMTQFMRSLVQAQLFQIRCPASKPNGEGCRLEWEFALCNKIGVFTAEETKEFEEGLSINWIHKNASECPNCKFQVIKSDLKSNRVVCPKCNYGDYCYSCSQKWRSSGFECCGNPQCDYISKLLENCEWSLPFQLKKNGTTEVVMLPHLRACPKPTCHNVVSFGGGCKHMTCPKCKTEFCWICLQIKSGVWTCGSYNDYCSKIAQTQQI